MNIKEKVKSFIEKYNLSDKHALVAFSGGWDSMCLLHILKSLNLNVTAIHLNHNWRGQESKNEALRCKTFCAENGIKFYEEILPDSVPKTETAARDERYKFYKKCAKKYSIDIVFTAHNATDNAETLIYRIAKGTGIAGLQGINEKRDIFYRPLIDISRSEIELYCESHKLSPNCDSSNTNPKYNRNFIRHNIMPLMLEVNKNAEQAINSLADIAVNDNLIIEEYLTDVKTKIFEKDRINTTLFLKLSSPVKNRLIREILIKNNIDYDRNKINNLLRFIGENSASKTGKTFSLSNFSWLFVSEKYIDIITMGKKVDFSVVITKEGIYETPQHVFSIKKFTEEIIDFPKDEYNRAFVNLGAYNINFTLRNRKDGDKISPMGLGGTMKLKKYLISKGIPKHERDELLFLCNDNEVLWAPSLGLSEKIKVVNKPTHVLKLVKREGDYED